MRYRAEIDGLRAVAVIPVILFHAGFSLFSGGFVGVDVFFVISGYLITTIIIGELKEDKFSIVNFYERRARRILPALFFVLLVCIPFAWLWLLPRDMKGFSQSLVAVSVFASNILFWRESGYFDTEAELKPLLHTWSLAVEEQYYVLYPMFLVFVWRFGKRWTVTLLVVVALISFGLGQWASGVKPGAAFYLLPTRGWELLVGALLAFYFSNLNRNNLNKFVCEAGGWIGLLLLSCAIFSYDELTPFPSLYTLVPIIGAALIILCSNHQQTAVGKILSSKALVGVGLISYSAYLWHQPLFAFARHRSLDEPSKLLFGVLALVSLVLAYFSWKYIEKPFREKEKYSRKQIFVLGFVLSALFINIGWAGSIQKIPTLWQLENAALVNISDSEPPPHSRDCSSEISAYGDARCKVSGSGNIRVVLWGDSHAIVLSRNLPIIDGVKLYSISHAGCPPIVGVRRFDGMGDAVNCRDDRVLNGYAHYIKSLNPDIVILVGRWTLYINGWQKEGVLLKAHHFLATTDEEASLKSLTYRVQTLKAQLEQTVSDFTEISNVIILTQPPDYAAYGFRRLERVNFSAPIEKIEDWHKDEITLFEGVGEMQRVKVLDSKKSFCDDSVCRTRLGQVLLYSDDNHLSSTGSSVIWRELVEEIQKEIGK